MALLSAGAAGCQPVSVPWPMSLTRSWMFGIETMRGDPAPELPYPNRFLADLAAMPKVQVVYVGDDRNSFIVVAVYSEP